jgi:hypothetical protein
MGLSRSVPYNRPVMKLATCWLAAVTVLAFAFPPARASALQDRTTLCAASGQRPEVLRRQLVPLGEPAAIALVALAQAHDWAEAACGIAGLAALGDPRGVAPIVAALQNPAWRDNAYQVARWAATLAGGADPALGPAMVPVVDALGDRAVWDAAGNDGIWLLGEIDHPGARDRLLAALDEARDDVAIDAVVHALARQGEPRARTRIARLGDDAARAKSGNATPEQARRLGEVAFYQLALGPDSVDEGLVTLGTIAVRDQQEAAAWAVQTLCARSARRPSERDAIEAHRARLVAGVERLGLTWSSSRVPAGCVP